MMTVPLSDRLNKVKQLIPCKCEILADIGSDHAYLPSQVCIERPDIKVIAGEVNHGPKEAATHQVNQLHLNNQIDVRLGNGLSVIGYKEVDCVTIAGMGGGLITSILTDGISKLSGDETLILQPNIDAHLIRRFAQDYDYQIKYENVIEEDGYYYDLLVLEQTDAVLNYSEKEIYLGPLMIKQPNQAFFEKWQRVYEKQQVIVNDMHKAKQLNYDKINQFKQELLWIEEALNL